MWSTHVLDSTLRDYTLKYIGKTYLFYQYTLKRARSFSPSFWPLIVTTFVVEMATKRSFFFQKWRHSPWLYNTVITDTSYWFYLDKYIIGGIRRLPFLSVLEGVVHMPNIYNIYSVPSFLLAWVHQSTIMCPKNKLLFLDRRYGVVLTYLTLLNLANIETFSLIRNCMSLA